MDREKELRQAGWRLVWSASRVHWGWIVTALTAALCWTATKVVIPLLAAAAIDQGIVGDDTGALLLYVGLMVAGCLGICVMAGALERRISPTVNGVAEAEPATETVPDRQ